MNIEMHPVVAHRRIISARYVDEESMAKAISSESLLEANKGPPKDWWFIPELSVYVPPTLKLSMSQPRDWLLINSDYAL